MQTPRPLVLCLCFALVAGAASAQGSGAAAAAKPSGLPQTKAPIGAIAYIISPKDGETVPRTFTVRFGLTGMGIAPAGVNFENTGHHHLIIDDVTPRLDMPIPTDDNHRHFGKGQTEVELTLPPGEHSLQLVLADANHIPHDPAVVSLRIHVNVSP